MIERPDIQSRIYRSTGVGDNAGGGIGAMSLPGTRIRGVIVDNPSGSWVRLDGIGLGFQPFIAPYTLAWSVSLLPSVTELSAIYTVGPTGQTSAATGSPMVVYVFEAQVPSSGGSTFDPLISDTAQVSLDIGGEAGSAVRTVATIPGTVTANGRVAFTRWSMAMAVPGSAGLVDHRLILQVKDAHADQYRLGVLHCAGAAAANAWGDLTRPIGALALVPGDDWTIQTSYTEQVGVGISTDYNVFVDYVGL